MSGKKLTPEEAARALRCCACDMPRCWECPARDVPYCHARVRIRAAELLEEVVEAINRRGEESLGERHVPGGCIR